MADGDYVGYTWDPKKSAATKRIRGLDFETEIRLFKNIYFEYEDEREFGEPRYRRHLDAALVGEAHYFS